MIDDKPKFTPGPWEVQDTREIPYEPYDWHVTHGDLLVAHIGNTYLEEEESNAALIAECPALYENEERNLRELTTILHFLELVTKNCEMNIIMRITALGGIVKIKERIKTTEQLLSKCRGEEKDADR